jgi:hypothetical protein
VVTRQSDTDNEYLRIVDCNSKVTLLRDLAGSAQKIYKGVEGPRRGTIVGRALVYGCYFTVSNYCDYLLKNCSVINYSV